jgi:hypothetical protein
MIPYRIWEKTMNMARIVRQLEAERRTTERELERIQRALQALRGKGAPRGKRVLSAAARKRIGDAQRLRWARTKRKAHGRKGPVAVQKMAA